MFKLFSRRSFRRTSTRSHLRIEPLECRRLLTVYTVSSTADAGAGSLRQAILDANSNGGADTIDFAISGSGVHTIALTLTSGPLPTIEDTVTIDGFSQSGATANSAGIDSASNAAIKIVIDGTNAGSGANGLELGTGTGKTSAGSMIRGLSIGNFNGYGISVQTNSNAISGNYIGTDQTGATASPNAGGGILLQDASSNQIGGGSAADRNLISGNTGNGIDIAGSGNIDSHDADDLSDPGSNHNTATLNHVWGNIIGLSADNTTALGNGGSGVYLEGAGGNVIGGNSAATGNVVAGNGSDSTGDGITITGTNADLNWVIGNYIGMDGTGRIPVGNQGAGVHISADAKFNDVGLPSESTGNLISGNFGSGILIEDVTGDPSTGDAFTLIAGNIVGLDIDGDDHDGSYTFGNGADGVAIVNSASVLVGYPDSVARNVISGNALNGVHISGTVDLEELYAGTIDTYFFGLLQDCVMGNYIGTDLTGTEARGNGASGVVIDDGARLNIIGASNDADSTETHLAERNIISGNAMYGVWIHGEGTTTGPDDKYDEVFANHVAGNLIGTNADGDDVLGNGLNGVLVSDGASYNVVGNSGAGLNNSADFPNVIAGNGVSAESAADGFGVRITGATGDDLNDATSFTNVVGGNWIGAKQYYIDDVAHYFAFGNTSGGILVDGTADDTYIGTDPLFGGTDPDLNSDAGNVIVANHGPGVAFWGNTGSTEEIGNGYISANLIGVLPDGTAMGNDSDGISIMDSSAIKVGGLLPGLTRNVISGNGENGVHISESSDVSVWANFIGTDQAGALAVGNEEDGVLIDGESSNVTIGPAVLTEEEFEGFVEQFAPDGAEGAADYALAAFAENEAESARNAISANGGYGIEIAQSSTGITVFGSRIGTDADGMVSEDANSAALGNGAGGVYIHGGASGNYVILGNVVSGNLGDGILIESDANYVVGNLIGVGVDGSTPLGNVGDGVHVDGADGNIIGGTDPGQGNTIANNGGDGVEVVGETVSSTLHGVHNAIFGNSIFDNGGIGIDLISGGNNSQPAPVLANISRINSTTVQVDVTVSGGTSSNIQDLEFFLSDGAGEGETELSASIVSYNSTTNTWTFTLTGATTIPMGAKIVATATNNDFDTSEFSSEISAP